VGSEYVGFITLTGVEDPVRVAGGGEVLLTLTGVFDPVRVELKGRFYLP